MDSCRNIPLGNPIRSGIVKFSERHRSLVRCVPDSQSELSQSYNLAWWQLIMLWFVQFVAPPQSAACDGLIEAAFAPIRGISHHCTLTTLRTTSSGTNTTGSTLDLLPPSFTSIRISECKVVVVLDYQDQVPASHHLVGVSVVLTEPTSYLVLTDLA
ncbi:hypothetical protein KQX54_019138 [Cotesia glomerata]|uniref:Uncharacterized protein n=1 Tax=Cotesia glomerata TaxID=32391 RepID=A0AAV7IYG9_COTGL|nr:hypothetical protein KQX54_019138 [Cotesia glomerata]